MGVHCRSSTAVQRIGDLFSTTNDFFLWMVILHKKEFIGRMRDLQNSISAVPSSAEAYEKRLLSQIACKFPSLKVISN